MRLCACLAALLMTGCASDAPWGHMSKPQKIRHIAAVAAMGILQPDPNDEGGAMDMNTPMDPTAGTLIWDATKDQSWACAALSPGGDGGPDDDGNDDDDQCPANLTSEGSPNE